MYKRLMLCACILFTGLNSFAGDCQVALTLSPQVHEVQISGTVTDEATGKPIADALVRGHIVVWAYRGPDLFERCPSQEVRADQNGRYVLTFTTPLTTSPPHKYEDGADVYASAPGYETRPVYVKSNITPRNLKVDGVDVALAAGHEVTGRILDKDGKPVGDAIVRVQNGSNGDWNFFGSLGKTTSDSEGRFSLWVSQGRQETIGDSPWLTVAKPGVGSVIVWDILKTDDLGDLMLGGGTVVGRVITADGKGVAGCEVSARGWPLFLIDTVRTDSNGRYELKGVPGEAMLSAFFTRKNGSVNKDLIKLQVCARMDETAKLQFSPQYEIVAQDNETVTAPDFVLDEQTRVTGRLLIPENSPLRSQRLLVRLDIDWGMMVQAREDGTFCFPYVAQGKHTITAYLPSNLRGDGGVGKIEIEAKPGESIENVEIPVVDMASVQVQFLDFNGAPLAGITAGASANKNGRGGWTEGTVSDAEGRAQLFLFPKCKQYVGGYDMGHRTDGVTLVSERPEEVEAKPGARLDEIQVVMVPEAKLRGRVVGQDGQPITDKKIVCRVDYGGGDVQDVPLIPDQQGSFLLGKGSLLPGVIELRFETNPLELERAVPVERFELKPGADVDLGDIAMKPVTFYTVSGKVVPFATFKNVEGLKVRLDLRKWEPMVDTAADGSFTLPKVTAGKHRITVYLPYNLRTDRGIGHTEIEVKGDTADVVVPLETLATVHMRIQDENGKPLEGISAAAWWTKDHSGVFTEGTKSDADGRATLYVYPDDPQFIGAHDWDKRYELKQDIPMTLKPGQVVENAVVVMVPKS